MCRYPSGACNSGWNLPGAAQAIAYNGTLITEPCRPYTPTAPSCDIAATAANCGPLPGRFGTRWFANISDLQQHIVSHGSAATGFHVYQSFFAYIGGGAQGVYNRSGSLAMYDPSDPFAGAHVATIVGFDNVHKWWLVKNR